MSAECRTSNGMTTLSIDGVRLVHFEGRFSLYANIGRTVTSDDLSLFSEIFAAVANAVSLDDDWRWSDQVRAAVDEFRTACGLTGGAA